MSEEVFLDSEALGNVFLKFHRSLELRSKNIFESLFNEANDLLQGNLHAKKRRVLRKPKQSLMTIDELSTLQNSNTSFAVSQGPNTRHRCKILSSLNTIGLDTGDSVKELHYNTHKNKVDTSSNQTKKVRKTALNKNDNIVINPDEPASKRLKLSSKDNKECFSPVTKSALSKKLKSFEMGLVSTEILKSSSIVEPARSEENQLLPSDKTYILTQGEGNACKGDVELGSFKIDVDTFQSTPKNKPANVSPLQTGLPSVENVLKDSEQPSCVQQIYKKSDAASTSKLEPKGLTNVTFISTIKNNDVAIKENDESIKPVLYKTRRTRSLENDKNKKRIDVENTDGNQLQNETPLTLNSNTKVLSSEVLTSYKTPYLSGGNSNNVKKLASQKKTPYKLEETKKKIEKENMALLKKEQMKMLTSETVRSKREDKLKKAHENKLAAEKKKAELLMRMQKEKEEKGKAIMAEKEKLQEEITMKKKILNVKYLEVEERRKLEEAAKLAKLKQRENEQKQLAAVRAQQAKEAAQLLQEQKLEEQKKKALESAKQEQKQNIPLATVTSSKQEDHLNLTKVITNINVSDDDDNFDDEEGNDHKKVKRIYPSWSSKEFSRPNLEIQAFLGVPPLHLTFQINTNPNSRELFDESIVSTKHRQRSSSIFWNSPQQES